VEQLNIVGKRSGNGFVAHKATLVNALSRALSDRVMLLDFTIGKPCLAVTSLKSCQTAEVPARCGLPINGLK